MNANETTTPAKCENVRASVADVKAGAHYANCPQCGGYLAVLASGYFRKHKPVFKPGQPGHPLTK